MDGITDGAFRIVTDSIGKPDVLYTEFVPADAIMRGAVAVLKSFTRHETKTPIIAQLFGANPQAFYAAAFVPAGLGFDGIDINMGCPDRTVMKRGGGGSLIGDGERARDIITAVKTAMNDFEAGRDIGDVGLPPAIVSYVRQHAPLALMKRRLPVSVKTRIGKESPATEEWTTSILEAKPDALCVHGRTLAQLYTGRADWSEIAKAARLATQAGVFFMGNGDISSRQDAIMKCAEFKCDGVLVGRNALGNPWFFRDNKPMVDERKKAIVRHCELFRQLRPELSLLPMRKHLAWYCRDFAGYKRVRQDMMKVVTMEDLRSVLLTF